MPILSEDQVRRAIEAMREYLHSPENSDGVTPVQRQKELDQRRIDLIENVLGPLVESFLAGKIPLAEFKSQVDGINKRNQLWGFKGIKGQMFFNMVFNVADDVRECEEELKAAIAIPANEDIASSRIKTFASYVNRIGQQFVETGGSNYGKPKVSSVPFFLSYFWQIQDHTKWPVYYTNSVNVMGDLNLWQPNGDLAQDYLEYKRVHEELSREFTEASGTSFTLYDVEHVFWFKGGNPYGGATPLSGQPEETGRTTEGPPEGVTTRGLPDSYVPPIVSILARLGRNDPELSALAVASGTSVARAYEKSVHAAFTIMGYETKLLGQGQGRVPDGQALDFDNMYAILWDAKARSDGFSMGTSDREIREYVATQSRSLRLTRRFRNIYYVVVSSSFVDDFDDTIRSLKMETDLNEVILMESEALIALVDLKLRAPHQISLGPDGVQRLLSTSDILTADTVRATLM